MFARKILLATATVATLAVSTLVGAEPASANDAAWAAGAAGVVGGLILGNALAQPEPEPYVVRRRPARVYEEEVVVRRRCWREVWYDDWGDRHVRRLCR